MVLLHVEGMGCGSCVSKISRAVRERDTGATIAIDLAAGEVSIESEEVPALWVQVLGELGYPARLAG